ncbi:MAG: hypothetical protein KDK36_21690, partial [Leptospiraceae bacterium]|nr:hypothetical protein [Leptospiraceae bacterium]
MSKNEVCPLCGTEIAPSEEFVSYSHFIEDSSDPLYDYSGCSFHKVCFKSWDKKETYEKKFNIFLEDAQRVHERNTGQ